MHSKNRKVEFDLKRGAIIVSNGTRFVRDYSKPKWGSVRVPNVNVQGCQRLYITNGLMTLPRRFKAKLVTPDLPSIVRLRVFQEKKGSNRIATYMNRLYPFSGERAIKAYTENLKDNL